MLNEINYMPLSPSIEKIQQAVLALLARLDPGNVHFTDIPPGMLVFEIWPKRKMLS
jgi:hypothetical protein